MAKTFLQGQSAGFDLFYEIEGSRNIEECQQIYKVRRKYESAERNCTENDDRFTGNG